MGNLFRVGEEKEEGLPRAGAFVVPLTIVGGKFAIDWAAIDFASNRPVNLQDLPNETFHVSSCRSPERKAVTEHRRE